MTLRDYTSLRNGSLCSAKGLHEGSPQPFSASTRSWLSFRVLCVGSLRTTAPCGPQVLAFPKGMKRFERKVPRVVALHDRVAERPRIAAYLASERRIAFSQWGIYRYFKELDH
jgi:hypothetical protein